jgi:hypothetical protein
VRLPGHGDCSTCVECGLTWCPDCDDEGRACQCDASNAVRGASAVEYALLIALIAGLILGATFMASIFINQVSPVVNSPYLNPTPGTVETIP